MGTNFDIICDEPVWNVVKILPSGTIEVIRESYEGWHYTFTPGAMDGGTIYVQCRVDHGIFCVSQLERYQVTNMPPPNIVDPPTIMTHNSTQTFTATYECGQQTLRWTVPAGWLINGQAGPVNSQNPVAITAPSSGSGYHAVKVEALYSPGDLFGNPKTVYIQLYDYPPLSVSISGLRSAYMWQNIVYTANVSGGNGSYQYLWQISPDGSEWYPGSNDVTHEYMFSEGESGIYVTVAVTDGFSNGSANYYTSCVDCSSSFSAYPSPAKSSITVDNEHWRTVDIELINHRGELVKAFKNVNANYSIQTDDLTDGPYMLKIISTAGVVTRRLFIKK